MDALEAVRYGVAGGFLLVGLIAVRRWLRHRDRIHAYLALATGLLGLVGLLARIDALTGYRVRAVNDVNVVAFLASGFALLMLRHELLPLRARTRRLALLATVGAGALALGIGIPAGPAARSPAEAAAAVALAAVWVGCVGGAVMRLWRAARGRPAVQRARLRAITVGYAGIIVILSLAFLGDQSGTHRSIQMGMYLVALLVLPLFYCGLAPPRVLRRAWRAAEEQAYSGAAQELLRFSENRATFAERALEWATRLVGADAAFVLEPDGQPLAVRGMTRPEAVALGSAPGRSIAGARPIAGMSGHVIVHDLALRRGVGVLGVVAGPLTPLFGDDEVGRLGLYAAAVAIALDRVELSEALRSQKAAHETLLEALSDVGEGVLVTDGRRVLDANDALCRINGYTREELLALPSAADLLVPEEREALPARIRGDLAARAATHYQTAILHRDGGKVEVEGAVKLLSEGGEQRIVVLVRDVTERRGAEAELRRSREFLAEAQQLARLGSWEWDIRSGRVEWSDEVYRIYGCGPGEFTVTFEKAARFAVPDDLPRIRENVERSLEEAGRAFRERGERELTATPIDYRIVRPDGAERVLHGRGRVFVDAAGIPVSMVGTVQDVTEREQAEAALRKAYEHERRAAEDLRRIDEMKDTFLTAVSHEMRTPLTAVIGFAHTLEEAHHELAPPDRDLLLKRLLANAVKLDRLLADLLDLDRIHRGMAGIRRRPTDLAALVDRVIEQLDLGDAHHPAVDAVPLLLPVDPPKVERIIENLLINAVKHTPPGTPVWVRVRPTEGGVLLAVEDAGPGVRPDMRAVVFEAFHRGDSAQAHAPGVGIGLTLVARFAELHGGRAWLEEREGGGASFRVFLPGAALPARVSA